MEGFAKGKLVNGCFTVLVVSNSYTMVFSLVDNPLALVSGSSHVLWTNHGLKGTATLMITLFYMKDLNKP